MIDTIYVVRHGYRLSWVTTSWKSETGLPRDPPLAAFGVTQAEETAAYFSSLPENERPTVILSSPYYRCLQTAQPIAKALNIPIYPEHGLSEWYSPVAPGTGLHPRPGSASELKAYFPEIDAHAWAPVWYPPRTGEDVTATHGRAAGFLGAALPALNARFGGRHKKALMVSHAATVITLVRALAGNRNLPVRVGCCSLTVAKLTGAEGKWEIPVLADGAHMSGGSTRDWGFEDIEIEDGKVINDPGVPGTEKEEEGPSGAQIQLAANL